MDFLEGSFTAGELEEFGALATFISVKTGNWDDTNTWDESGIPDGNPVVIVSGDTVFTNGNSRTSSTLDLEGTLDIASSIGHDFGSVTGTGTLIIASSNFPAGDYAGFVAPDSGTVKYDGNITLPTRATYNNINIDDANTKTLPNIDITLNGDLNITNASAVLDASVNDRILFVKGDWNINDSGNFTPGSGTVTFNGSQNQGVSGVTTFHNLTIENTLDGVDLNSNIIVNGSLTFKSGEFKAGAQTITVSGDITNNATASALQEGSSTVNLNGGSTQTIDGSAAITFNNFTASNSDGTGINVNTNITVNNNLTINDGNINTGSGAAITLGKTNGNISGELNTQYVIGTIKTTKTVGTGSNNMGNLGVDLAAGSNDLGDVTLKRVTGSNGIVTISGGTSIARRWVINSSTNPNSRDVTFSWLSADDNAKDMTRMRMFRRGTEGSGDFSKLNDFTDVSGTDPRTVTVSVNSFSEFAASDDESTLPVELIDFEGTLDPRDNEITLDWSTATEKENFGFYVHRAFLPLNERESQNEQGNSTEQDTTWTEIGFVEGHGTTKEEQNYTFTDTDLGEAGMYLYKLKQIDFDGQSEYFDGVEVKVEAPEKFRLSNNYPNPFNPTTTINYTVSRSSQVTIKVYNVLGREVATLVNKRKEPGNFSVVFDAAQLSSGIYIVRMLADGNVFTKKMTLVK